jgi:sulfatase maturation enzyme AslB (radical SAM superfamily)
MCARRPYGSVMNPFITLNEITLEIFKKWFTESFLKQLTRLFICGNLGDPIVAKETLEIFQYIREINPSIALSMNTNGSGRSVTWWENLAKIDVNVIFGIDGLEDTHSLYRIDTDWNKIIKNAERFILAGGRAEWHMLVFKHNEHQIDSCRQLSTTMGFSNFLIKHSSRFSKDTFPVLDENGHLLYNLYPTQISLDMISKMSTSIIETSIIHCKVKKNNSLYIGSDGSVSPCCWLDLKWNDPKSVKRINYVEHIEEFPNLFQNSLDEIFESNFFEKIESTWKDIPLFECSRQCGKFNKFGRQFDEN